MSYDIMSPLTQFTFFLPTARSKPQAQPLICKCQNGGVCVESEDMRCACDTDYSGTHCETEVRRRRSSRLLYKLKLKITFD